HPDKPAIAIGHVMRKLLHLAFAVWKTNKPFEAEHYPWHAPAHLDREASLEVNQAAGLESGAEPTEKEVTAACNPTVADEPTRVDGANIWLDFAHIKKQLPMVRLLDHLGLTSRLKGSGPQ